MQRPPALPAMLLLLRQVAIAGWRPPPPPARPALRAVCLQDEPKCGAWTWKPYFNLTCAFKVGGRASLALLASTGVCGARACSRRQLRPAHDLRSVLAPNPVSSPPAPPPRVQRPTGWTRARMPKEYEGEQALPLRHAVIRGGAVPPAALWPACRARRTHGGGTVCVRRLQAAPPTHAPTHPFTSLHALLHSPLHHPCTHPCTHPAGFFSGVVYDAGSSTPRGESSPPSAAQHSTTAAVAWRVATLGVAAGLALLLL